MSKFELNDLGEGHFALNGEMTFETAERILLASEEPFEQHTRIEVDLAGVTRSDSAGVGFGGPGLIARMDYLGKSHCARDPIPVDARTRSRDRPHH
jgi:hypothetical protein